eukprot:CAMPEP_0118868880 /NCGR_PEP_ID=MMETSP1163-20130328/12348_1 /TAXON_ID=124430 /ORGANISM="Phaeomonas parva, Strain CCMP2877" /LENGTH=67 /DNA_ID=CAMNT_0006803679 /DNA_START=86 /DNA_END=285 /DNA_ORIENTATION=-
MSTAMKTMLTNWRFSSARKPPMSHAHASMAPRKENTDLAPPDDNAAPPPLSTSPYPRMRARSALSRG